MPVRSASRKHLSVGLMLCFFWIMTDASAQTGTTSPFSILELDASARAAALGGTLGATPGEDVSLFFYNPATISGEMDGSLSLTYLNHIGDLNAGIVAYGIDITGVGSFAAGLRFLNWGTITGADEQGVETSTFGASDFVVSVGGATEYADRVRLGASLHGIVSSMESYSATALAGDVGVLWSMGDGRTAVGAGVHNLGIVTSSFGNETDRLPTDLRLSVTHRLQHLPLQVSLTGHNLHKPGNLPGDHDGFSAVMRHLALGGEFQFSEAFNLRVGYNHQRHQDLKMNARLDLAGVGMGFGLKVNRFFLDYAFNSWSSLGGLHQITVRTRV